MVRWLRWHCPPYTGFEIRALAVWGRARYLSVTEAPHNTDFHTCFTRVSFKLPRPGTEPRTLAWKAAVLTTTLGPPPTLWPANTTRQLNAGSTLVHRRRLWPFTSTLDSAFCWRWCVHRVQVDTNPMAVECWAGIHSSLVSTSCWPECVYTAPQWRLNAGQRRTQWPSIRIMHVTPKHFRVNGVLASHIPAWCFEPNLG